MLAFQNYLVSAESSFGAVRRRMMAMVVTGGMRSSLDRRSARFFILFRDLFSIWTPETGCSGSG